MASNATFWLVLFIQMTRGASVQVEIPTKSMHDCQIAADQYRSTGMSSVVIWTKAKCEQR
jgi:hypothetical protein